jgi:thiamine-monophosphate kinase
MGEFDLIRRLQQTIAPAGQLPADCILGIGDDAAVLDPGTGRQLVVTMDTLVEGIHFPARFDPEALGHKALAVNLSDLAAMGARPAWFFLALTMTSPDGPWLDAFARGMSTLAREASIALAGGDTTSGPLSITITAMGFVEPGQALTRAGAQAGDIVVLSGTPGLAAYALKQRQMGQEAPAAAALVLDRPVPRLGLGRALSGMATACIDISDGLMADLGHILEASGVGAEINLDRLPVHGALASLDPEDRLALQLGGGDDYELCFTLPGDMEQTMQELPGARTLPLTVIGRIVEGATLSCKRPDGREYTPAFAGFDHFNRGGSSGA